MVSTSPPNANKSKPMNKPMTPVPKYPVERGSSVDSRHIIQSSSTARRSLRAVRLSHILFASDQMAEVALEQLKSSTDVNFFDLASQLSNCATTRSKNGEVGWVSLTTEEGDGVTEETQKKLSVDGTEHVNVNEHLDEILPRKAREEVLRTSTKPGDIMLVESERGVHLVQIVDVMVDVNQLSTKRKRAEKGGVGVVTSKDGGVDADPYALPSNKVKYYKIETMGCQMNAADSERIEGQLQSMGIMPLPEIVIETKSDDMTHKEQRQARRHGKQQAVQEPDIVILNTCSIRDHAEQKVYSYIGRN
jgi:hypothetical protein